MRRITFGIGIAVTSILGIVAIGIASTPAGAVRPLARAALHNAAGVKIGTVEFKGTGTNAERVEVEIALPAGDPGGGTYHGLHVHTVGQCVAPFTSASSHWNLVTDAKHGHHTGDLPSVLIGSDGKAYAEFETHRFDVTELFDGDGSAVVLHAGPDNFGNVPIASDRYADPNNWYNAATGTGATGDAGSRYACGVVTSA